MRFTIIILNTIALILTGLWIRSSNFDYEPTILFITLVVTLLATCFKIDEKAMGQNHIKIKGNKSTIVQKSGNGGINKINAEGDENNLTQDNRANN